MEKWQKEALKKGGDKIETLKNEEVIIELSDEQRIRAAKLIRKECCEYDCGHCGISKNRKDGAPCICIQMFDKNTIIECKFFAEAVLPIDKLLYAELYNPEIISKCSKCGKNYIKGKSKSGFCQECNKKAKKYKTTNF